LTAPEQIDDVWPWRRGDVHGEAAHGTGRCRSRDGMTERLSSPSAAADLSPLDPHPRAAGGGGAPARTCRHGGRQRWFCNSFPALKWSIRSFKCREQWHQHCGCFCFVLYKNVLTWLIFR
jgi:hypothetical protein